MGVLSKIGKVAAGAGVGFITGSFAGAAVGAYKGYADARSGEKAANQLKDYDRRVATARELERAAVKPGRPIRATPPATRPTQASAGALSPGMLALAGIAIFAVIRRR